MHQDVSRSQSFAPPTAPAFHALAVSQRPSLI